MRRLLRLIPRRHRWAGWSRNGNNEWQPEAHTWWQAGDRIWRDRVTTFPQRPRLPAT